MKHSTWLQNHTLTCALNRKTPYKMRHGKKPYLASIQEFLNHGICVDPKAHVGRFMGYNSKRNSY